MISDRLLSSAEREILGTSRSFRRPVLKGATLGLLAFIVFEYVPFIRPAIAIPPIPTVWLTGIGATAGWLLLNLHFLRVLRNTRREDLFFVYGLGLSQRREVLSVLLDKYRRVWFSFVFGAIGVAIVLEFAILGERSFVNLALMPLGVLSVLVGSAALFRRLIAVVGPARKDSRPLLSWSGKGSLYSRFKAEYVAAVSGLLIKFAPRSIRPLVLRNAMYLFRAEPVQPIFFIAVPVFLFFLLRYVGNTVYGMNEFILLVAVFVIQMVNTEPLREASFKLLEHPCCRARRRDLLLSLAFIQGIPALPALILFPFLTGPQVTAMYAVRFVQFILALTVSSLVTARTPILFEEKRYGFEFSLLGICGLGLFIAWFGSAFILLSLGMFFAAEWRYIKRNEWFSVV
ncbi:MAG: hypothetical protein ACOCXC_02380 [Fibrobacterota bacterium]